MDVYTYKKLITILSYFYAQKLFISHIKTEIQTQAVNLWSPGESEKSLFNEIIWA